MTQRQIEDCLQQELKTADHALADAYAHYLASRSATQRPLLEKAQEVWKTYREAECRESAADYEGGTMEAAGYVGCKLEVTRDRLHKLKRTYEEPPFSSTTTSLPPR